MPRRIGWTVALANRACSISPSGKVFPGTLTRSTDHSSKNRKLPRLRDRMASRAGDGQSCGTRTPHGPCVNKDLLIRAE